jgi:hypothetical protein
MLRKLRMGVLKEEIYQRERGTFKEVEGKTAAGDGVDEDGDDDDDELKKLEGTNPIGIGPDGSPLKRNNSDVMNNFFINYAV